MIEKSKKYRSLNRRELHEFVWQAPLRIVAARLGISSRELSELCRRHNVPYPHPAFWARKRAGLPVVELQLPEVDTQNEDPLLIVEQRQSVADTPTRVPRKLAKPHPIIAAWLADREHAYLSRQPEKPAPPVAQDLGRRLRLLDAIICGVEDHGILVRPADKIGSILLVLEGPPVRCAIRAKRPSRLTSRRIAIDDGQRQAVFAVTEPLSASMRRRLEWSDTAQEPLERRVGNIIAALVATLPDIVSAKRQLAEELRQTEERRWTEYRETTRQKREQVMWDALVLSAEELRQVQRVETLLAAIERDDQSDNIMIGERKLADWIAWAKRQAQVRDWRRRGALTLFRLVVETSGHG